MIKKALVIGSVCALLLGGYGYDKMTSPEKEQVVRVNSHDDLSEYDREEKEIAELPEEVQQELDFLVTLQYEDYDKKVAYQEGQEEKVKEMIANQHDYLNRIAGWGGAEKIDFEALMGNSEWMKLKDDIAWSKSEGFVDSAIINDMRNARAFVIVAQTGDSMAIRYLHRIFHDLDAEINGNQVDKIWEVTHAFGRNSEQERLYKSVFEKMAMAPHATRL